MCQEPHYYRMGLQTVKRHHGIKSKLLGEGLVFGKQFATAYKVKMDAQFAALLIRERASSRNGTPF